MVWQDTANTKMSCPWYICECEGWRKQKSIESKGEEVTAHIVKNSLLLLSRNCVHYSIIVICILQFCCNCCNTCFIWSFMKITAKGCSHDQQVSVIWVRYNLESVQKPKAGGEQFIDQCCRSSGWQTDTNFKTHLPLSYLTWHKLAGNFIWHSKWDALLLLSGYKGVQTNHEAQFPSG